MPTFEPSAAPTNPLCCPVCESPLDAQRFADVSARLERDVEQRVETERVQLQEQYRKEIESARATAEQKAAARVRDRVAVLETERDNAVSRAANAEEGSREAVRAALAKAQDKSLGLEKRLTKERDAALEQAVETKERAEEAQRTAVRNAIVAARANWDQDTAELIAARDSATMRADAAEKRAKLVEQGKADAVAAGVREAKEQQKKQMEAKAAEADKARQEAAATEQQLKLARARIEAIEKESEAKTVEAVRSETQKVRELLEADHQKALNQRAVEAAREREALKGKVTKLQRQLEKKTSNELGDGAELDLYETLRERFPDDRIERVAKGEPGADIRIVVRSKGIECGLILLDSKNRRSWQHAFATKLRNDQLDAGAEHAVLSTAAFPKGHKELCVVDNVLVASPARVPDLVGILRTELVKLHSLRAGNEDRKSKREELYAYVTSEDYRLATEEAQRLNQRLQELDVEEKRAHDKVWKTRGTLLKKQERASNKVEVEVAAILGGQSEPHGT